MSHTLSQQTAQALIEYIQQQRLQPGDRLPNETVLSQLLGVGRNTLREAVRQLVSRNIVTIRQGAGTFVSEKMGVADDPLGLALLPDRWETAQDLLQLRTIIEPPIAALAAQNATPEDIAALEEKLTELEAYMGTHGVFAPMDMEYHVCIARCTHNRVISNLIPTISEGVISFAREVGQQEFQQTLHSHRLIFEAIRDHRPSDAQQEMLFHLLYNRNRFHMERTKKSE
ncbi:MAG: FadR/GntR family transcriptional regulator [Eubacteriales bacterium]|jgi:DNA-binding FadR family transcriptional regulator